MEVFQPRGGSEGGKVVPYSPILFRARCHRLGQSWNSSPDTIPPRALPQNDFAPGDLFDYRLEYSLHLLDSLTVAKKYTRLNPFNSPWSYAVVKRLSSARWCCCQFEVSKYPRLEWSTNGLIEVMVPVARLLR